MIPKLQYLIAGLLGILIIVLSVSNYLNHPQGRFSSSENPTPASSPSPTLTFSTQETNYVNGASGLVISSDSSGSRYYHSDRIGSVKGISDSSGSQVFVSEYEPFGSQFNQHGNSVYRFTGKEIDGSGLYYSGARYYDSEAGRFTQVDPIGGGNPYAYANNNPMRFVDPSGTEETDPSIYWEQAVLRRQQENLPEYNPSPDSSSPSFYLPPGPLSPAEIDSRQSALQRLDIPGVVSRESSPERGGRLTKKDYIVGISALAISGAATALDWNRQRRDYNNLGWKSAEGRKNIYFLASHFVGPYYSSQGYLGLRRESWKRGILHEGANEIIEVATGMTFFGLSDLTEGILASSIEKLDHVSDRFRLYPYMYWNSKSPLKDIIGLPGRKTPVINDVTVGIYLGVPW